MTAGAPRVAVVIVRRARHDLWRLSVLLINLVIFALPTVLNPAATADPTPVVAGEFVPVTAASLVKTTSGVGWSGKLRPDATNSVRAAGVLGIPATGVRAVMLHISTSNGASADFDGNGRLWVWPAGAARPQDPTVTNAPAGSVADNTAIVQVGRAGRISFYNGPRGTAVDVTADVEGYVTSSHTLEAGAIHARFAPLPPRRIIDTSDGTGGRSSPLTPSAPWTFHLLGVGGIPRSGVAAIALNVGARATGMNCWVQVRPAGTSTRDPAYPRIDTYADYMAQKLAVVPPAATGDVTFSTDCSWAHIFVDVEGFYLISTRSSGDVYVPMPYPTRVVDTSSNLGISGKITAGRVISGSNAVAVTGVGGIPSHADAVALSIGTLNGNAEGHDTIWADGTAQSPSISTVNVDPKVTESNLIFVRTGPTGKIDVAGASPDPTESNDLYVDIEGYFANFAPPRAAAFAVPQYFPNVVGDTYFNTVDSDGGIVATSDDSRGANDACGAGSGDVVILHASGADPAHMTVRTVNCMSSYGTIGGGNSPDGCSWKSGGITRIGRTIYLAVARQLRACSYGKEANGLQPSFNASIVKSVDGGHTWTNPWGMTSRDGAAPPYDNSHWKSMFPGQSFSAPFFIQYGPGNTHTADDADKYLYAVSTDGYAYNGNYLRLARVPLNKIMDGRAWQFYHGPAGGNGTYWTGTAADATHVLQARHGLSQPAIQYVPALKRYVLITFFYLHARRDFPTPAETPYTQIRFYSAPKPWGPWTKVFDHGSQRNLWCASSPCRLTQQPGSRSRTVGTPDHWLGLYDPVLVQKFLFTHPLNEQALFTSGDFKNSNRYAGERLYRLHAIPFDLTSILRP